MKKPIFAAGATLKITPLHRIMMKTGRRPTECRCYLCKRQCQTPCLGTPQDILQLMDAGYIDRLKPTMWAAGVVMGLTSEPVPLIQAECLGGDFDGMIDLGVNSHCTFQREDGLCELHDKGLKPTEGRLSHHSIKLDNWKATKSISWAVVQEWLDPQNADVVEEIVRRYKKYQEQNNMK